jgi:hypothetical protein
MELLAALAVTSIIILYFFAIEKIGRQDLINADHRAKVQNDVSYVIDHMTTNINGRMRLVGTKMQPYGGAIGNTQISSQYPVDTTAISGDNAIKIWIDSNNNGQRDSGDKQIAYRYRPSSASPVADRYQIWYYSNYTDSPGSSEVIGGSTPPPPGYGIRPDFSSTTTNPTYVVYTGGGSNDLNYLDVQITGCWDPTQPDGDPKKSCGTANNPSVVMHAYINMPSVSTH